MGRESSAAASGSKQSFPTHRIEILELLSDTSARLLASSDPDGKVLPRLFKGLSAFGVDAMFSYAVAGDQQLRLAYYAGVPAESMAGLETLRFGEAVCGMAALTASPVHVSDVQSSTAPGAAFLKKLGIGAYACEPLLAGERLLGTLSFATRTPDGFRENDLAFFRAVARLVAIARERACAEEALRRSKTQLNEALQAARLGTWERDLRTGTVTASAQHKMNFGLPPEAEFSFDIMHSMRHPEDRDRVAEVFRRAIEERQPYDMETRVIWPDGSVHWLISRGHAVFADTGEPVRMLGFTLDITERKQAESLNERLGRIVEGSMSEVYIFDAETLCFVQVNRGARDNLGYTMEELKRLTPVDIKPEFTPHKFEQMVAPLRSGAADQIDLETVHQRKDGSRYDVAVRLQLMRGETDPVFFAAIQDITARKQAERRLDLVAREMDHRANNLLAVVQSVVRLTQAESLPGFIDAVQGRIQALSHAHALMAGNRWEGADLRQLIEEETAAYRGAGDGRVQVSGTEVALSPSAAQAIAMAVHELITNAAKYGALSTTVGRVTVEWEVTDRGLELCWQETGGPPVHVPDRRGFGTGVIDAIVHQHLDGEMRFDWRPEGLVCEMSIPLDVIATAAGTS